MDLERPKTLQTIEGFLYVFVLINFALSIALEVKAHANIGDIWGYDAFGNPIIYAYVMPWVNYVLFTVQRLNRKV